MLEALWPCLNVTFTKLLHKHEFVELDQSQQSSPWPKVSRLPLQREGFATLFQQGADMVKSESESSISSTKTTNVTAAASDNTSPEPDTLFASRQALLNTSVGNLVHAVLEQMVDEGIEAWDATRLVQRLPFYKQWLGQQGLKERELDEGLRRTERSLANAIGNSQLCWALGSEFVESQTEQPLTALEEGGLVTNHIIDRTFVDNAGVRWIVDYKTSIYEGRVDNDKALELFIQQQIEYYQPQLERYGRLFAELENRPQKWVLYFSYIDQWIELN